MTEGETIISTAEALRHGIALLIGAGAGFLVYGGHAAAAVEFLKQEANLALMRYEHRNQSLSSDILDNPLQERKEWVPYLLALRWNKGLLEKFQLPQTAENRRKLVISYLTTAMNDFVSLRHLQDTVFASLPALLDGRRQSRVFAKDRHSLERHLHRAGSFMQVIMAELYKRAQYSKPGLTEEQMINAQKILEQLQPLQDEFGSIFVYLVGLFHDIGRYVSMGSDHEEETEKITVGVFGKEKGARLMEAIHQPVPLDRLLSDEELAAYDTPMQRISRLADVFGKSKETDSTQLRSFQETIDYSAERQMMYFSRERDTKGSFWYGKTQENVEIYLKNEARLIAHNIAWLKSAGVEWEGVILQLNTASLLASSMGSNPNVHVAGVWWK